MTTQILPVILSGGSGARLWPLSREQYPKQLLPLFDQETLLQSTATRLTGFKGVPEVAAQPLVVCNEEYRFITAEQLRAAGKPASTLILEPMGRNTAPALTLAALASAEADPVLLVMPADHVVTDKASFRRAIEDGAQLAVAGAVVTFGIVPDRPETGYGYTSRPANPASTTRGASPASSRNPTWRPPSGISRAASTSGTADCSCCVHRSG